jgi:hypothetical protein
MNEIVDILQQIIKIDDQEQRQEELSSFLNSRCKVLNQEIIVVREELFSKNFYYENEVVERTKRMMTLNIFNKLIDENSKNIKFTKRKNNDTDDSIIRASLSVIM